MYSFKKPAPKNYDSLWNWHFTREAELRNLLGFHHCLGYRDTQSQQICQPENLKY